MFFIGTSVIIVVYVAFFVFYFVRGCPVSLVKRTLANALYEED